MKQKIAAECIPAVKKIARSLARRNTDPIEDIIQVGSMGLIKAIESFDQNIGKNFRTYATHMITGEIRHYLRDKVAMIKAPREIQELAFLITYMPNLFLHLLLMCDEFQNRLYLHLIYALTLD